MEILSINSHVAYGHVGHGASVFPLQCLGFEVWPVHSVALAHHPGYGTRNGAATDAALLAAMVTGLIARDVPARAAAIVSGYLGSSHGASTVRDLIQAAGPDTLYACDPVMGDGDRLYVDTETATAIAEILVPLADILTPNRFELARLTGRTIDSRDDARAALADLRRRMRPEGARLALLTGFTPPGQENVVEMILATRDGDWRITVPRIDCAAPLHGCGDALAALFVGHLLRHRTDDPVAAPVNALAAAAGAVHRLIEATVQAGTGELALVAARSFYAAPGLDFAVQPADGTTYFA